MARAVVLDDRAQEEVAVELERGPGVEDVDRVDVLAGARPVEPDAVPGDRLVEPGARLEAHLGRVRALAPGVGLLRVVVDRAAEAGLREDVEPAEGLGAAHQAHLARGEDLPRPGLTPPAGVHPEEALAGRVHPDPGEHEIAVAPLHPVLAVAGEDEGHDPLEPGSLLGIRVEARGDEAPALGDPGLVHERRVHLEVGVVVLGLGHEDDRLGLVRVEDLAGEAVLRLDSVGAPRGGREERPAREVVAELEGHVGAGHAVVAAAELAVGE